MSRRPFINWDIGLHMDYDKELWPFIRKMDIWVWATIINNEFVSGGHHLTVTREDVKGRTGFIKEQIDNNVALWSLYPTMRGQQLLYDFTILRIHTKGGVVLRELEDIKSFLLK